MTNLLFEGRTLTHKTKLAMTFQDVGKFKFNARFGFQNILMPHNRYNQITNILNLNFNRNKYFEG